MFSFYGRLGRKAFLWASGLRVALFVASIVGFPFFLQAIATLSNCRSVGGACGAVGLVGSAAYKPLVFALFVFSFVGLSMRRARDAGIPGWAGLLVPLLFLADQTFLVYAGTPWSFGFANGVLWMTPPRYTLLALVCIAALGALPSRAPSGGNPFGPVGWVAFALALFVGAFASWVSFASLPAALPLSVSVAPVLRWPSLLLPYAMVAFAALLAWIAWRERNHVADPTQAPVVPASHGTLPVKTLLILSLVVAVATFRAVEPTMWPLLLVVQSTTMLLPTLLMYFALFAALFLVATRPRAVSFAFLALAALPFAHWAYSQSVTAQVIAREEAEIAAIATSQAPRIPATFVFDSQHSSGMRAAWNLPGVQHVIAKGSHTARLVQFDRTVDRRTSPVSRTIDALPSEYLVLKVGRSSSFAKPRQVYATAGGPLELRYVDGERDVLVGVWYRAYNPPPSRVPLLTTMGWFRGSNSATTDDVESGVRAFLNDALAPGGKRTVSDASGPNSGTSVAR
jgi:uncharacterized membrane protein YhaH (DUF805 family)